MENNHRRPIEANITPNDEIGAHLTEQLDGSITIFGIGKVEERDQTFRDQEFVYTFHHPIFKSSVREDKADFHSKLSNLAQESFRRHTRSSERRVDTDTKPDS